MMNSLCIIGFGRLGETLADILSTRSPVAICEADEERAKQARSKGYKVITQKDISTCKVVILCVPISRFEPTLSEIAPYLSADALVMDVCSVKTFPVDIMKKILPSSISIIATHPLFGPDSINKGFKNLTMVMSPVRVSNETYAEWEAFWTEREFKVITTTPDEHDKITAYTLGMSHFFGRIMSELQLKPEAITTVSYSALFEVMQQTNRDTWQLFHDMQHYNPYAKQMRDKVYAAIQTVEDKLDAAILE